MRPYIATALLLAAITLPARAQSAAPKAATASADTISNDDQDEGEGKPGFQYGVASGALSYAGGRTEQSLGAIARWVPVPWIAFSVTPTMSRIHEPATSLTTPAVSRSGFTDLPLEATATHAFHAPLSPTLSGAFGITLPTGDTASGFGSGTTGYSISGGIGFTPTEKVWTHFAAGRSLSGISPQSAFGSGSGWGDASAGMSLTDRFSVSGGYGTDLGAVDPTLGRSTSLAGGFAVVLAGANTLNVSTSHGLSGAAPNWSLALGIGTAFPYLNHLGAGSASGALRGAFTGGTHGLGSGSGSIKTGRGRP